MLFGFVVDKVTDKEEWLRVSVDPLLDASSNLRRIEERKEELKTQTVPVHVAQDTGQIIIEKHTYKPVVSSVVEVSGNVEEPTVNKRMDEAGVRYVCESQNDDKLETDLKSFEDPTNPCEVRTAQVAMEDEMQHMPEDGYASANMGSSVHGVFMSANDVNGSHEEDLESVPGKLENDMKSSTGFEESEKCMDSLTEKKENEGMMDTDDVSVCSESNDSFGSMKDGVVKCSRRRRKVKKSCVEVDSKLVELSSADGILDMCEKKEVSKNRYSRTEMEAIGFGSLEVQQMRWNEIYQGLPPTVARELDQIFVSRCQKQLHRKVDQKKQKKHKTASNICEANKENLEEYIEGHPSDHPDDDYFNGVNDASAIVEEMYEEDETSDDEDPSIQRPAFYVDGDPDFESGPPQDGFEYIRRVRWEAAHIPKIKVAKVCSSKLNKEQTLYMPSIPEIVACPQHLMPSEEWQKSFLEDFTHLRVVLSQIEISRLDHLKLVSPVSCGVEAYEGDGDILARPKIIPTFSSVLSMDSISRASMLRNRIGTFETANTLSKESCLWIFSLCLVVDTPIDADMGASFRILLRKCSSLRAKKSEHDDEVVMLNILAIIAGKYFGQAEC